MKHLDGVEQRLEQAAQEARMVAKHSAPPPLEATSERSIPPGWLIFAAVFGVVILALGVVPLISSPEDGETAAATTTIGTLTPSKPTTGPAPASTVPEPGTTVLTTILGASCSAAGLPLPGEQAGLPEVVAEARMAIAEAALACDYEALEALAAPDFVSSFGGGGIENIRQWEEDGTYPATALIVQLLATPYAYEDYDGLPRHYYWPSAFVYDSWDAIPPTDVEALRDIYTQEELDQTAAFGSYALWRIGITETGEWRFFIAGD
ncbi:MAG TPA: hypothetical protein VFV13_03040 [Acidimicrobiia bacterium]|nr:hypothetical protein [Acidimicrobiia bacterium]